MDVSSINSVNNLGRSSDPLLRNFRKINGYNCLDSLLRDFRKINGYNIPNQEKYKEKEKVINEYVDRYGKKRVIQVLENIQKSHQYSAIGIGPNPAKGIGPIIMRLKVLDTFPDALSQLANNPNLVLSQELISKLADILALDQVLDVINDYHEGWGWTQEAITNVLCGIVRGFVEYDYDKKQLEIIFSKKKRVLPFRDQNHKDAYEEALDLLKK